MAAEPTLDDAGRQSAARRRKDGHLVLTGHGNYLDDLVVPGALFATFVRSTVPAARIIGIDTSRARRHPDVVYVLEPTEAMAAIGTIPHFYDPAINGGNTHQFPHLALGQVYYVGQPIVAVVARSLAAAEQAADDVVVDYERVDHVIDARESLSPQAPSVFGWDDNVATMSTFAEGDADRIMASAPHRLRETIDIQRYQTAPMEPRGYVAQWDAASRLTLHATAQCPHPLRSNLATMLGVPEHDVRVVAPRLGGAFGHKFHGYPEEGLVCLLARLTDSPVSWTETRADALVVGAREMLHDIEVGFNDDGNLLALRDDIVANVGALGTMAGVGMAHIAAMTFPGPYAIHHYRVSCQAVVTNKPAWNGARGYGKESACLAIERMVDLAAQHLDLDPALVRRRNFIPADHFPYWTASKRLDSGDYQAVLDKALSLADYPAQVAKRDDQDTAASEILGVGIAFELTPEGGDFPGDLARGFDTTTIRIHPGGTVTVLTGVTSPGTGNETGIAQIVAARLGIDPDEIRVIQGDTDLCPFGYGNGSSKALNLGGGAAALAADDLHAKLVAGAAALLDAPAESITLADGNVLLGDDVAALTFPELVRGIYHHAVRIPGIEATQLEATRTYAPTNLLHTPDERGRTSAYPTYSNSAHVAVVTVDVDTGKVHVLDYTAVDDCGTVINPLLVESQLLGAIVMGIGGALWEEQPYQSDGSPVATSLKTYLMPRTPDLPRITLGSHETPSPFTLLGTKGAGEGGLGGAVAAIANAVNDALRRIGAKAHVMPLSAPNVLAAIDLAGVRA